MFNEKVRSIQGTCGAALILICGLVGMSIFSVPAAKNKSEKEVSSSKHDDDGTDESSLLTVPLLNDPPEVKIMLSTSSSEDQGDGGALEAGMNVGSIEMINVHMQQKKDDGDSPLPTTNSTNMADSNSASKMRHKKIGSMPGKITRRKKGDSSPTKVRKTKDDDDLKKRGTSPSKVEGEKLDLNNKEDEFQFFGGKCRLSRRQLGIIGAVINGVWGGNNMIPLHYAR